MSIDIDNIKIHIPDGYKVEINENVVVFRWKNKLLECFVKFKESKKKKKYNGGLGFYDVKNNDIMHVTMSESNRLFNDYNTEETGYFEIIKDKSLIKSLKRKLDEEYLPELKINDETSVYFTNSDEDSNKNHKLSPNGEVGEIKSGNYFHCKGATWFVCYKGKTISIKNTLGVQYISYLLKHEGTEFPVDYFYQLTRVVHIETDAIVSPMSVDNIENEGLSTKKPPSYPMIDKKGLIAIRKVKEGYKKKRDAAALQKDIGNENEMDSKIKEIDKYINSYTDKNGNIRFIEDNTDKNRKSIRKAILLAKKNIKEYNSALYLHLDAFIKTGNYFLYKPDPPMNWDIKIIIN